MTKENFEEGGENINIEELSIEELNKKIEQAKERLAEIQKEIADLEKKKEQLG